MFHIEYPLFLTLLLLIPIGYVFRTCLKGKFDRVFGTASCSSIVAFRPLGKWKTRVARSPQGLLIGVFFLGVIALANPQGRTYVLKDVQTGYRVCYVMDVSGSMAGNSILSAERAAKNFVLQRKLDTFAVLPFSDTVLFSEALTFTSDRKYILYTLDHLTIHGSTAVGDGLLGGVWEILADTYAVNDLKSNGFRLPTFDDMKAVLAGDSDAAYDTLVESIQRVFGNLDGGFIIMITDEGSNTGLSPTKIINFAGRLKIPMYIISIGVTEGSDIETALKQNGGQAFRVDSPTDIQRMSDVISELRPTITNVVYLPERISYRPYIALCMVFLTFASLSLRSLGVVLVE